jgi:hypothetical protein
MYSIWCQVHIYAERRPDVGHRLGDEKTDSLRVYLPPRRANSPSNSRHETVALLLHLSHLDHLFSTRSVALFLPENYFEHCSPLPCPHENRDKIHP